MFSNKIWSLTNWFCCLLKVHFVLQLKRDRRIQATWPPSGGKLLQLAVKKCVWGRGGSLIGDDACFSLRLGSEFCWPAPPFSSLFLTQRRNDLPAVFPSSDYAVPIHIEVSIMDVPRFKTYTHMILHPTETNTHTQLAKQIQENHSLMFIATILTCAGGSPCEWLTSSASIHQAVEVFPGSIISVLLQFYATFRLHIQKPNCSR